MNIDKHVMYLKIAEVIALASHATRNKVGALIVKDGNIISFGYNGTPAGFDNKCELDLGDSLKGTVNIVTKSEVLHAESNAIAKCARTTASSEGATLYLTTSPCFDCAKLIIQAGISEVYYSSTYRNTDGLLLLDQAKVNHNYILI